MNIVMVQNSEIYDRKNQDWNSSDMPYKPDVLTKQKLDSPKFQSAPGMVIIPESFNSNRIKEVSFASKFQESWLHAGSNHEIKMERGFSDQKYFLVCKSCFWCASYLKSPSSFITAATCPLCNEGSIDCLAIGKDENYTYNPSSSGAVELNFSNQRGK